MLNFSSQTKTHYSGIGDTLKNNFTNLIQWKLRSDKVFQALKFPVILRFEEAFKCPSNKFKYSINGYALCVGFGFHKNGFNYSQKYKLNRNFVKRKFAENLIRYFPQLNGYFTAW